LQRAGDRLGDFVLNGEYIHEFPVIAFGPEIETVLRVHQLRCDTDAVVGTADAAFQDGAHVQRLSNLGDVLVLAAKHESGGASGNFQVGDTGQEVNDVLGEAIAEVFVVGVAAHVGERQDSDRRRFLAANACGPIKRRPSLRYLLVSFARRLP
jgi:hypothetical protein